MKSYLIIIEKKCLLILAMAMLLFSTWSNAAIPLHRLPATTTNIPDSLNTTRAEKIVSTLKSKTAHNLSAIQKIKMVRQMKKLARYGYKGDDNKNGMVSGICALGSIATFAVGFALLGSSTLGIAGLMFVLSLLASLGATIFGAIGIGADDRKGLAIAGMIVGILMVSIATVFSFLWLLLITFVP